MRNPRRSEGAAAPAVASALKLETTRSSQAALLHQPGHLHGQPASSSRSPLELDVDEQAAGSSSSTSVSRGMRAGAKPRRLPTSARCSFHQGVRRPPGQAGEPLQLLVVAHHHLAGATHHRIQLHAVGALAHGLGEGLQGVLRGVGAGTAVGEQEHAAPFPSAAPGPRPWGSVRRMGLGLGEAIVIGLSSWWSSPRRGWASWATPWASSSTRFVGPARGRTWWTRGACPRAHRQPPSDAEFTDPNRR